MPYISINNFKFGLDTRRSQLSAAPGSLIQGLDGHITEGGSFEIRKAFSQVGAVKLPANTFGFERVSGGVVVFGSAAVGGLTLPAGVTYVQCAHPTDTNKAMTAVLCSCCFGGQAFCIAKFGTEVYWYLDGDVILASIAGQALTYYNGAASVVQTIAMMVTQLYNNLSSQAFKDEGIFVENLSNTGFNVYTSYGVSWQPFVQVSTANSGKITTSLLSTSTEPVHGSSADAQITLYAGSSGSLSVFNCVAGSTTYKMLSSAAVTYATSINNTAALISSAINSQASRANGLAPTASSSTNNVIVSAGISLPSNYLQLKVTGDLCFENMALDFSGVTNGSSIKNIYVTNGQSVVPAGTKYGGSNPSEIVGNQTGTDSGGHPAFFLPFGTYLYVPGAADTAVSVNGTVYTKANYPNGLVITYSAGAVGMRGTGGVVATCQLFALTDILAHSGIAYTGAASLANIAAAITARADITGFVASNTQSTTPLVQTTTMYISRGYNQLNVNSNSYNNIFFYLDPAQAPGISPAGFASIIAPTQFGFGTAVTAVTGRGPTYKVVFSGTWVTGDTFQFNVVTAAKTYIAGAGNLTGLVPSQCITLNKRVHVIAGSSWLGSDNDDATQWEEQAAGAFKIDTSNEVDQPESLTSLAPYQGMMALFSPRTVQIWALNADPNLISLTQVLTNLGSVAGLSAQPLGDLDVIFLHSSGIRSLRARQALLNASVVDIGAPVDELVSGSGGFLPALSPTQIAASCGVVEPTQNRYWCYIPATSLGTLSAARIFVLSYFPSNKIVAWTEYSACAGATYFMPLKFVVYNQQVYMRGRVSNGDEYVYYFGGSDGITYDTVVQATVQVPFYDEKKPGHEKFAVGFDVDLNGTWTCYGCADWVGNSLFNLGTFTKSSFDDGIIPYEDIGTHFSFKAVGSATSAHPSEVPTVTSLIFHYEIGASPAM